jgi:hypothetical protein
MWSQSIELPLGDINIYLFAQIKISYRLIWIVEEGLRICQKELTTLKLNGFRRLPIASTIWTRRFASS